MVGCVRASGAPDSSSRRQPETTYEVFREVEVASQQHKKFVTSLVYVLYLVFYYALRGLAQWLRQGWRNGSHPSVLFSFFFNLPSDNAQGIIHSERKSYTIGRIPTIPSNQFTFPAYSQLNPWFRWFPDASFKPLQFGLVAEEAAAAEEKITIPSELCSVKPKKGLQSPWIVLDKLI